MPSYNPPTEDFNFLLFDVFNLEDSWQDRSDGLDRDLAHSIIEQCGMVARDVMEPLSASSDAEGAHWKDGDVFAPAGFQDAFKEVVSGGWLGTAGNPDYGGQGLPRVITTANEEMFWGANTNLWLYASLTVGATFCIEQHATNSLKELFLPPMYEGRWTGAMALTESHAGTDLGLLKTRAESVSEGCYKITGTKIFITSGEHDLAENIIHLVLARMTDAPSGTRGISLFLVPKYLVNDNGEITERNQFSSGSIEHKMGIRGSATSVINYDGAIGYLVGEPNAGLRSMFTMMNFARLSVGVQGLGLSERAYQMAVSYSKERLQGRSPTGPVNESAGADPIIEHPDVRKMLLRQKALVEAGRAFSIFVAKYLDDALGHSDPSTREKATKFVELLTPIAKAFMTDRGMEVALLAQQCFGGHGYIVETGIEQVVRDVRISQIYEGTNGIQAMDLIGRKVLADGGVVLKTLIEEMRQETIDESFKTDVDRAIDELIDVTDWLVTQVNENPSLPGAVATDYLNLSGYVIYAWLCARMSLCDSKGLGKKQLANFYFDQVLPMATNHLKAIRNGADSIMKPDSDWF